MNTQAICFLCLLSFTILGCDSEIDESGVLEDVETQKEVETKPASWVEGFPAVYSGTRTLKVAVSITSPGNVYYVVSDKKLEGITGSEIKEMATAQKDGADQYGDNLHSGILEIGLDKTNDTVSSILETPSSANNYFSYFIAESQENDSIYFFLDGGKIKEIVNFISPRETQDQYASAKRGKQIYYLFYALEDYCLNPETRYPLLVFLHGKGEYGNGNKLNLYKNGIIPQLIHDGMDLPFVVVSPQIDTGRWDTDFVDEFIDHIIAAYRIDENQIYMTGNSLGGIGTWEYAGDYPDRLAAIVPISGEGDTLEACFLKDIPVWAFHNAEDGIVDARGTLDMIEAIRSCDSPSLASPMLTIYPGRGHDAWIRTYDLTAGHDIYNWMLTYSKTDQ